VLQPRSVVWVATPDGQEKDKRTQAPQTALPRGRPASCCRLSPVASDEYARGAASCTAEERSSELHIMDSENAARPLLVIDGDSLAHRAYHGLPKTIRRAGDKGAGAILGFANYLLRLYGERPRAVVVGWDTLDAPNWRLLEFPQYQGGRSFDDELLEQLEALPAFVEACGFTVAKAPGYEADDFLAAAVAVAERRGWTTLVASGDRDTWRPPETKLAWAPYP
jgi:hypothetical protein